MRYAIRQEIAAIQPADAAEQALLDEVLAWVDSGVELCRLQKPATPPRHLVSYFVVVDQDHVLLVDHINAQRWLPPGGHVEPGEHPRHTVLREIQEELGLVPAHDIGPPLMLTSSTTVGLTAGHCDVSLWYVVRLDRSAKLQFDAHEFHAVRWFGVDNIPWERAEPGLPRFIRKLKAATP